MRFWEHIFDLFAGFDVPVRHIAGTHIFFHVRCQTFSLTYTLHDLKGTFIFHAHTDQIDHNIITGTDRRRQRTVTVFNIILCIAKPYIGTM